MDGRPKRIKKFAFTSVCVYNRLRVDGASSFCTVLVVHCTLAISHIVFYLALLCFLNVSLDCIVSFIILLTLHLQLITTKLKKHSWACIIYQVFISYKMFSIFLKLTLFLFFLEIA